MMARAPALVLKSLAFKVSTWVRNPRAEGDVPIYHGPDQLELLLEQTDITVCQLPLARETKGIFCTRTFAMMPRGAMLVNVGHGKHVVDEDLISALDSGQLSYAALDALWPEPLPLTSPLWLHPKVTVMPHVARRPTVAQTVTEIAVNIRSIQAGGRLSQEVDITTGYWPHLCIAESARPLLQAARLRLIESNPFVGSMNNTRGVTVDRTTSSSCGVPVTAGRLSVRSCQGVPHLATGDLRPSINCFCPAVVHSRLRIG
jgi:hypothetical protein